MNLDTENYAWLAKDSYTNLNHGDIDNTTVILNGHEYKVFDYQASPSGFHATAYQQLAPPYDIVIAYRGTDPGHLLTTVQDAAVDTIMVGSEVNPQIRDAERFTERVLEKARERGISPEHVTVAGHSLGGTLAEACAYKYNLHGQTFNAFGAAELNLGIPEGGNQVINNVLAGDPVSAGGHHFGTMRHYATTADIDSLRAAGYLDGQRGVVPALHAMRLGDHSIDNFAPEPGEGPSVLTAVNEARAKENAPAITVFREDIHAARAGLHVAMQPGMPLAGLHATAWSVEGLTAAGLATAEAIDKSREVIEREALRGAHAVKQVAHHVAEQATQAYDTARTTVIEGVRAGEHALHETYDATRREVVQGIHATEQVAHQAYDAARQGIAQGVHATEQAVSRGIGATEHAVQAAAERASDAFGTLRHPGSWFDDKPNAPITPARLDQPAHPDHALFRQALRGVHQLDIERGRTPDQHSDRLAAALTVQARHQSLDRIDQVALSTDGERAFALQHGALTQHAHVQTAQAVQTSVTQSSAAWQQLAQQKSQEQQTNSSMEPPIPQPAPSHGMSR